MKKLKAAVIGVGGISNEHINGYIKNENVDDDEEETMDFM